MSGDEFSFVVKGELEAASRITHWDKRRRFSLTLIENDPMLFPFPKVRGPVEITIREIPDAGVPAAWKPPKPKAKVAATPPNQSGTGQ